VIVAPGRSARPYDFRLTADERRARCPFCPGHEDRTPKEVAAIRPQSSAPDTPGWSLRVVPNLYPAVSSEAHEGQAAYGIHEVIIETPDHQASLADFDPERIDALLETLQQRVRAARQDPRIEYVNVFKNHGVEAGASLEHSHTQLLALPFTPRQALAELGAGPTEGALIARDEQTVVLAPAAARFPYELRLEPAQPTPAFEDAAPQVRLAAARRVHGFLGAMNRLFDHPPYHLLIHTAPFRTSDRERFRWRIELFPRLVRVAGFEWATGVFINTVSPEQAADSYRQALAQ
jgi:UDPglucose--hexose-1-phosphate uridylyltransferase